MDQITVKGARAGNLKHIDVSIPLGKLVVMTGVSGSGKSSLAFDTLYAEGQRRYVESLSAYARQFLGRMPKPECDAITGLPPAIAIEQKVISHNPRSTVGTATEIYHYLRLLYARIGHTYSPVSGQEVRRHTVEDVIARVAQFSNGTPFMVLAPLQVAEGRTVEEQLKACLMQGYSRVWTGSDAVAIEDFTPTDNQPLFLVIDRLRASDEKATIDRLADSAETAFLEGQGALRLVVMPSMLTYDFSTRFEADGITFEQPTEATFSFNSPAGACPQCQGTGIVTGIDPHLVIANPSLSVYDGCVVCWNGEKSSLWKTRFCRDAAAANFPIFEPYCNLTAAQKRQLWHGLPPDNQPWQEKPCIDAFFHFVEQNQHKIEYRVMLSRYKGKTVCPTCNGTRLKPDVEAVKVAGRSITSLTEMPVEALCQWFNALTLPPHEEAIAHRLLKEIRSRLGFLCGVGLGYLTLARACSTLSGGESQRISLSTALGSALVGSLYVLDEPSIGLHPCDTGRLIQTMKHLVDLGNTVVVVEHDEQVMRAAQHLIDLGTDAGIHGGEVVYQGPITPEALALPRPQSHTIELLSGRWQMPHPTSPRPWNRSITLHKCRLNNLRGITVDIPLNVMTVVTGVSGSGKSSLITGILYPALRRKLGEPCEPPGAYGGMTGDIDAIGNVELVDQTPIGRSSRSNPVTYIKAYDAIRTLFAQQPLAQQMGFAPQHFSFNADGGRCPVCKGAGTITIEMQFMAPLTLPCEQCHGKRFTRDVLDVRFHGLNIDDVLHLTVEQAITFFTQHGEADIAARLQPLADVGLHYVELGQSSLTLSGGENQRLRLALHLSQATPLPTMFIFDEPTTGLHPYDLPALLAAFSRLIKKGHTIIIIEHNLHIIRQADHIIDLGPGGGPQGGQLVMAGTPQEVAQCEESETGKALK